MEGEWTLNFFHPVFTRKKMYRREASYMFSSSIIFLRILSIFIIARKTFESQSNFCLSARKSIKFPKEIFSYSIFFVYVFGVSLCIFFVYIFVTFFHMFISWFVPMYYVLALQLLPKWLSSLVSLTSYT